MEIIWYGLSCFRISERGSATVITDPYGTIGGDLPRIKADIVTVSHDAPGHNNASAVAEARHTLDGPGEYEIGNTFVTGILTNRSAKERRNVAFVYDLNGLTVAHLGDISKVPSQTQIETLGDVSVLLLPVGNGQSLNATQAAELVSMIEPGIVIPMHYAHDGHSLDLDPLDRFLKEMGSAEVEAQTSLRVSSSNIPEETQTVVLKPKR